MLILFICTGNVSRSAVAECILRTMAARSSRGDIEVASAGTHDMDSEAFDTMMVAAAAKHGYQLSGHSKRMTADLLQRADLILTMDFYQYVQVQRELPYAQWNKLYMINRYCYGTDAPIDDPYNEAEYDAAVDKIEDCCQIILSKL